MKRLQAIAEAMHLAAKPNANPAHNVGYVVVQTGEEWTYYPTDIGRGVYLAQHVGDKQPMRLKSV
jgi:hypothetical protein